MKINLKTIEESISAAKTQEEKADLNNELASTVMGWTLANHDPMRLWRDKYGEVVQITSNSGKRYALCANPWVSGLNNKHHLSFNPVLNHNHNIFDFKEMLLNNIDV